MRMFVVLVALIGAAAYSENASLPSINYNAVKDWHRELDTHALILAEFSVDATSAGNTIGQVMDAYGVSFNAYLNPNSRFNEAFQYQGSDVSLATALEAIGDHYGLKLEHDKGSGVTWLVPLGMALKEILPYRVTIEESRPGWPLHSRLLATLERPFTDAALRGDEPVFAVGLPARGFAGSREASFDIGTHLPAGDYKAIEILHYCNLLAPWMAFILFSDGDERFPYTTIYARQPAEGTCGKSKPGWNTLWNLATNGAAPDVEETLQTLLRSEKHGVFAAHLAKRFCRSDRPFLDALNRAKFPLEKANIINSYVSVNLNATRVVSLHDEISHAGATLLEAGFYEKGPASIALPLLLHLAVAQRSEVAATKLILDYAERRSFTRNRLQGAELHIGKAAYLSEAVWRALMDSDAKGYIDTGGWAASFLPNEFRRLAYQNFYSGLEEP